MLIDIPLFSGFSLKMNDAWANGQEYPTSQLQKGLILSTLSTELSEEAVGFGVPLLKRGLNTIFPGSVELKLRQEGATFLILAVFKLNLVEKLSKGETKVFENKLLYDFKNLGAAAIRRLPFVRGWLTSTSRKLRKKFNLETSYAYAGFSEEVKIEYLLEGGTGKLVVKADASSVSAEVTEVVVMNEQGAHYFDKYEDSSGTVLEGDKIGCWDEVDAEKSWFTSNECKISFRLDQIEGARLFRGRELVDDRLAWAGFGYSFHPSIKTIRYEIDLEPIP